MTAKRFFQFAPAACVSWLATGMLGAQETPPNRDQAFVAADAAWGAKNAAAVREALAPVVADASAPVHFRSLAHLRSARSWMLEGKMKQAADEFATIAANETYPKHHRDEATACRRECERLAKGQPARDPAATRVPLPPLPPTARTLHVLPTTDQPSDSSTVRDGSREHPFTSVEAAVDAVRAAGPVAGGTTILLAPGRHVLTKGLRLTKELGSRKDAPLVIRSVVPGAAVLYGGRQLSGFHRVTDPAILQRLPAESRDQVVQCDLKALGITDFANLRVRGYEQRDSPPTLEMFANGKPQTLARWPNDQFVKAVKLLDPGDPNSGRPSVFSYADDRHARWAAAPDAWLSGYFHFLWAGSTLPIGKIDAEKKTITTAEPYKLWGMGMNEQQGILYYAFNLLEELDQAGEWYLDRKAGMLYWYPDGDPAKAKLEISMLADTMLTAEGLEFLRLEGLVFDCARLNGLELKNCSDLIIAGCTVRRMAGSGLIMDGGFRNQLIGCDFHTLGRLGSRIAGGDRPSLTPGEHVIANCRFRHFGRIDRTYTPAILLEGVGNRIAHCLFENCPSSALRIEGNDHIIEYNELRQVVLESDDQGAIDMWNNPTYRGVVFRYNLLADIGDGGGLHAGQGGIRLDDVICGVLIYGNVFHRAGRGFGGVAMNCGRDNVIDNNLFIDCPIAVSGGYGDWNGSWMTAKSANPPPEFIMSELFRTRYPELNRLFDPPFVNHMWRNAIIRCPHDIKWWSTDVYVRTANALRGEDPGFVVGQTLNRKPSEELFTNLGLRPIPISEMGLYADPLRDGWHDEK